MKYFDVKPEPTTAYESWQVWRNWTQAKFLQLIAKKIDIKIENDNDYEFVFIDKGSGVKGMSVF